MKNQHALKINNLRFCNIMKRAEKQAKTARFSEKRRCKKQETTVRQSENDGAPFEIWPCVV